MKGLFFICLFSVSQNIMAQFVIGKNIEQKRFNQIASNAVIRDSIKNIIKLQDIYDDVLSGKMLLISENSEDSTGFYALDPKSKMIHKIFAETSKENERLNRQQIGKIYPDFEFTDLDGNSFNISQFRGKVLVINFWFIGCKPCRMEIPGLNELVKKYKTKDIVFFAFAMDKSDALKLFLEKNEYLYTIVPDATNINQQNRINSFPTNLVIDASGNLTFFETGYSNTTVKKLGKAISKLLE